MSEVRNALLIHQEARQTTVVSPDAFGKMVCEIPDGLDSALRRSLRIAAESPGTDRGSQQVYWPGKPRQDSLRDDAIKLAQYQPFGSAGAAGNGTDSFLRESVLTHVFVGAGPGFEFERVPHRRLIRLWR